MVNMLEWESMTENYREGIDELFTEIRLRLLEIRQSDPLVVEDLKATLCQLEDYVESLIIDWLRLKGIKDRLREAAPAQKAPREKQGELEVLVGQVEAFLDSLKKIGLDDKAQKSSLSERRILESIVSKGKTG